MVFCTQNETIDRLFFHGQLAKFIWRLVRIRCGVRPPNNISVGDLFSSAMS
jgi:hypothetical protein